jgi:hypothetical protein
MTQILGNLGQLIPSINTLTTLFTMPDGYQGSVTSIYVCNQTNTLASFDILIAVDGASFNANQYLYYQCLIDAMDSYIVTTAITMGSGDQLWVNTPNTPVSFSAFGVISQ